MILPQLSCRRRSPQDDSRGREERVQWSRHSSFGDPGIEAAKELANIPVVGITEASYSLARLLATKFLVIVSADTAVPRQMRYIKKLGIPDHKFAFRPIGLTVLGVMENRVSAKDLIAKNCEQSLKDTGAELIVMGCSGSPA